MYEDFQNLFSTIERTGFGSRARSDVSQLNITPSLPVMCKQFVKSGVAFFQLIYTDSCLYHLLIKQFYK